VLRYTTVEVLATLEPVKKNVIPFTLNELEPTEATLAEMYVKLIFAEAEVAAVEDGIKDEVAGVNDPLTTLVTNNVFPPLLK
jgi:hypothetical protein